MHVYKYVCKTDKASVCSWLLPNDCSYTGKCCTCFIATVAYHIVDNEDKLVS